MSFWTSTAGGVLVIGAFALTAVTARSLPDLLPTSNEVAASPAISRDSGRGPLLDPVTIPMVSAAYEQDPLRDPTRNLMLYAAAESSAMTFYPIVP